MRPLPAVPVLLLLACQPAPEEWTLRSAGASVTVRARPFGLSVRDATGAERLRTLDKDRGDGWAPLAFTTGTLEWGNNVLSEGQYTFAAQLDPWRGGAWTAEEGASSGGGTVPDTLHAVLRGPDGAGSMTTLDATVRVLPSRVRVEIVPRDLRPRAMAMGFASAPAEGFLGFGERFTRTDYRGVSLYSWAEEGGIGRGEGTHASADNPGPNGESMTYYPVPFFVSTAGYGFWLDSTWRSTFDLATDHADAWRVWHIGPALAFEIYLPTDDARPWPYHLVDAFTQGRRPMAPPDWAWGPRRRATRTTPDGLHEIDAMRRDDLAITAVDDATHFLPNGSHVGREEQLRSWVSRAHSLGYKVCGYYNSLLSAERDSRIRATVEEGEREGYFLEGPDGPDTVFLISGSPIDVYQVDFTHDRAVEWFQGLLRWGADLGYDCHMWDFGEYVQPDSVGRNGMTGEELHNLYPVLYDKAGHDAMQRFGPKDDWLLFARAGYTGSSQWMPATWSGDPAASFEDTDGLPSMVRAAVNAGISGAPNWGGDISGFHCVADGAKAADGELLARWIEQGALTPIMMDQNACVFATDGGTKASLWTAPEAKEAWRVYGRLHTRLFPYLKALGKRASATGEPIVRHLFFEHPDRPELRGVDDTYYFGPSLLVAPVVTRGARERTVPLPPALFMDWRDGSLHAGPGTITTGAPLTSLPLFLRAGRLVPLLDPAIDTLAPESATDIVGPADVAGVLDVVGLLGGGETQASFALADGGTLRAHLNGGFVPPALPAAAEEAALSGCDACWRSDTFGGTTRLRITASGDVAAGGLSLQAPPGVRVRWDLFVAP